MVRWLTLALANQPARIDGFRPARVLHTRHFGLITSHKVVQEVACRVRQKVLRGADSRFGQPPHVKPSLNWCQKELESAHRSRRSCSGRRGVDVGTAAVICLSVAHALFRDAADAHGDWSTHPWLGGRTAKLFRRGTDAGSAEQLTEACYL